MVTAYKQMSLNEWTKIDICQINNFHTNLAVFTASYEKLTPAVTGASWDYYTSEFTTENHMGMWCRRAVCWGRVLLGCNKPPIRTHTHDRRSKNPKFNGKTTVDSRELSSQDMGSIRCCESPHSIVCLLQGKSYLLIYTCTYNSVSYTHLTLPTIDDV